MGNDTSTYENEGGTISPSGMDELLARARLRYDIGDFEVDDEETSLALLEMIVLVDAAEELYGYTVSQGRVDTPQRHRPKGTR